VGSFCTGSRVRGDQPPFLHSGIDGCLIDVCNTIHCHLQTLEKTHCLKNSLMACTSTQKRRCFRDGEKVIYISLILEELGPGHAWFFFSPPRQVNPRIIISGKLSSSPYTCTFDDGFSLWWTQHDSSLHYLISSQRCHDTLGLVRFTLIPPGTIPGDET
jgi:hypothetical protein